MIDFFHIFFQNEQNEHCSFWKINHDFNHENRHSGTGYIETAVFVPYWFQSRFSAQWNTPLIFLMFLQRSLPTGTGVDSQTIFVFNYLYIYCCQSTPAESQESPKYTGKQTSNKMSHMILRWRYAAMTIQKLLAMTSADSLLLLLVYKYLSFCLADWIFRSCSSLGCVSQQQTFVVRVAGALAVAKPTALNALKKKQKSVLQFQKNQITRHRVSTSTRWYFAFSAMVS